MMRLEHVRAGYDGKECLHDLCACFAEGEITGLIGPNGSGKSTLIKAMACQIPLISGQVFWREKRLDHASPKEIARRIAYMPQTRIAPTLTVRQLAAHGRYPHLHFGRSLSKDDLAMIEEAMQTAAVAGFAGRAVNGLSGGERQRSYLAMALAQDTEVLLLDEPTAYLDMKHQFQLMELLTQLKNKGKTIVVVLHELALALSYCDRLMLMQEGENILFSPPDKMYASGMLERVFEVEIEKTPAGGYAFRRRDGL